MQKHQALMILGGDHDCNAIHRCHPPREGK
jgi:hypothetical protein